MKSGAASLLLINTMIFQPLPHSLSNSHLSKCAKMNEHFGTNSKSTEIQPNWVKDDKNTMCSSVLFGWNLLTCVCSCRSNNNNNKNSLVNVFRMEKLESSIFFSSFSTEWIEDIEREMEIGSSNKFCVNIFTRIFGEWIDEWMNEWMMLY